MNEFRALAIGSVLTTLCGCAAGSAQDEQSTNPLLPGYARTGEMRSCVEVRPIGSVVALNESTLLVRGGAATYLNVLGEACRGAGAPGTRVEYVAQQEELCRDDIISIVDNSADTVVTSCTLGAFETLLKVEIGPQHNQID